MPYYDYRCTECGAVFEVRASIKEMEAGLKVECPQCHAGEVRQVITAGLVIHGSSGDSRSLCGCGPNAGPGCCG
jgi:putative FmdB family regulatory protein